MKIESDICEAVRARINGLIPDIGDRVAVAQKYPTSSQHWPCVLIDIPRTNIETSGTRPGQRPRKCLSVMNISIIDDGNRPGVSDLLREYGQAIDEAMMSEPHLPDENGRPRVTDISLVWSAADTVRQTGAIHSVRQVSYAVTYHTREDQPGRTFAR